MKNKKIKNILTKKKLSLNPPLEGGEAELI